MGAERDGGSGRGHVLGSERVREGRRQVDGYIWERKADGYREDWTAAVGECVRWPPCGCGLVHRSPRPGWVRVPCSLEEARRPVVKDAERTLREKAMAWALRQVGGADAVALADRIEAAL